MPKFWCCGTSKKKKEEPTIPEFQILLLGTDESGKLNIVEKLATLESQFTPENRIRRIIYIKHYIRDSITEILQRFDRFVPPIQLEHLENQWRVTYILTTAHQNDFNYPVEFFEHVVVLWADAGVKLCFERSKQQRFMNFDTYFFDRINEIKESDYIPTDQDMIHSRFLQSNVYEMTFNFNRIHYRLSEVDLLRRERRKWMHCFNTVHAIIFVVDCSNFNLESSEYSFEPGVFESIGNFHGITGSLLFRPIPVILLFNKQDLLANKIKNGFRVEDYFREHDEDVKSLAEPVEFNLDEDPEISQAKYIIQNKFLKINAKYSKCDDRCYPHFISDVNMETIRLIFEDCRKIIVQQKLSRWFFN